jgi:hypothetical protein
MSDIINDGALDVLWGAEEIAAFIRRSKRDVYRLLDLRLLDANKVGNQWITTKSRLIRQFNEPRVEPARPPIAAPPEKKPNEKKKRRAKKRAAAKGAAR